MNRNRLQTIRLILLVVLVVAFLVYRSRTGLKPAPRLAPQAIGCGEGCGEERWPVKTLTDSDAIRVNFSAQPATVDWLVSRTAPSILPSDSRIAPIETQVYVVTARLVGFKLEEDRDIHIVIADLKDASETMIVEIPSVECSGACASAHYSDFQSARTTFVSTFGTPIDRFHRAGGTVRVTGVAFFDFLHHQTGVAPNGIEIHPVLSIQAE